MTIEVVLERLQKVKKATKPDSWLACCPAHDDKRPSLLLTETTDGRVLIKCWAGCEVEDVLAAIGLQFKDLYPERLPNHSYKPVRQPFNARDVLRALAFEVTIVLLCSKVLLQGLALSEEDQQRLSDAFTRIVGAEGLINAD